MTVSLRSPRARSQRPRSTGRRNGIYVGLLILLAAGVLIDAAIGPGSDGVTSAINNAMVLIGSTLLAYAWQREDARSQGRRLTLPSRLMTLLFAPVGLAIYLFRARSWKPALAHCLVIATGILVVFVLASSLGDWLVARGVFPLETANDR